MKMRHSLKRGREEAQSAAKNPARGTEAILLAEDEAYLKNEACASWRSETDE
jgi:hypothetical protein